MMSKYCVDQKLYIGIKEHTVLSVDKVNGYIQTFCRGEGTRWYSPETAMSIFETDQKEAVVSTMLFHMKDIRRCMDKINCYHDEIGKCLKFLGYKSAE